MPELLPALRLESGRFFEDAETRGERLIGIGVYDALGAQLVEHAGFGALWLSGLEVSSSKGLPDRNLVTSTEMLAVVQEIRGLSALPILVDADNGYGSDETAARAACQFAAAGATAMSIEDNAFPKRNSFMIAADRALEDADVFADRIRAMRAELDERGLRLELIARTEALVAGLGSEEALARLALYRDAGADALFVQFTTTSADEFLELLPAACRLGPVVIAPTKLPEITAPEFHALGVTIVLFANVGVRCRTRSEAGMLARLAERGRLADVESELLSIAQLFALTAAEPRASCEELSA